MPAASLRLPAYPQQPCERAVHVEHARQLHGAFEAIKAGHVIAQQVLQRALAAVLLDLRGDCM